MRGGWRTCAPRGGSAGTAQGHLAAQFSPTCLPLGGSSARQVKPCGAELRWTSSGNNLRLVFGGRSAHHRAVADQDTIDLLLRKGAAIDKLQQAAADTPSNDAQEFLASPHG